MSDIRESIWDFVYGLLSDEESQALIARIKSEPDVARMYAEVRLEADLVAEAARVQDSSVVLNADKPADPSTPAISSGSAASKSSAGQSRLPAHRIATWLAGAGATALALLLVVGLALSRTIPQQVAATLLVTDVIASQPLIAGLTCPVELRTYHVAADGEVTTPAAATNLVVNVLDGAGKQRLSKTLTTDDAGHVTIDIPGEDLQPGARLDVAAASRNEGPPIILAAHLPVQPEPQVAYFLLGEPAPQPQQQVPYAAWYMNAFSCTPAPIDAAGDAPASAGALGGPAPQSSLAAANGVVNGVLEFDSIQRTEPLARALSDQKAANLADRNAAPQAKSQRTADANEPLQVAVPKELQNKPLVVAARNRGATVAQATVDSLAGSEQKQSDEKQPPARKAEIANQQFALSLPPEAEGLIEVDLFDKSTFDKSKDAQQPADRQFVYRQSQRRLKIESPNARSQYNPGEEVALTLRCTDESGNPAPNARLGVRVWKESAIRESGEEPVLLADALEQALPDEPQPASPIGRQTARSYQATDGSLSQQAAMPAITQPVTLASNRATVKAAVVNSIAHANSARAEVRLRLGRIAVGGGACILLLLAILYLSRLAIGWRTASPVLAVAVTSLLVGFLWLGRAPDDRLSHAVASRSGATPAAAAQSPANAASELAAASRDHRPAADVIAESRSQPAASTAPAEPASAATSTAATSTAANSTGATTAAAGPAAPSLTFQSAATPTAGAAEQSYAATNLFTQEQELGRAAVIPPSVSQKLSQARGQIANVQLRGTSGGARLELATNGVDATTRMRRISEPAGFAGGAAGGAMRPAMPGGMPQQSQSSPKNDQLAEQLDKRAAGKPGEPAAPQSLYFNPELMTDAEGTATVHFTMPAVQSEYRVLVDALGQRRVGSHQQTIICGDAPAK
jgi:hypothetical protein